MDQLPDRERHSDQRHGDIASTTHRKSISDEESYYREQSKKHMVNLSLIFLILAEAHGGNVESCEIPWALWECILRLGPVKSIRPIAVLVPTVQKMIPVRVASLRAHTAQCKHNFSNAATLRYLCLLLLKNPARVLSSLRFLF